MAKTQVLKAGRQLYEAIKAKRKSVNDLSDSEKAALRAYQENAKARGTMRPATKASKPDGDKKIVNKGVASPRKGRARRVKAAEMKRAKRAGSAKTSTGPKSRPATSTIRRVKNPNMQKAVQSTANAMKKAGGVSGKTTRYQRRKAKKPSIAATAAKDPKVKNIGLSTRSAMKTSKNFKEDAAKRVNSNSKNRNKMNKTRAGLAAGAVGGAAAALALRKKKEEKKPSAPVVVKEGYVGGSKKLKPITKAETIRRRAMDDPKPLKSKPKVKRKVTPKSAVKKATPKKAEKKGFFSRIKPSTKQWKDYDEYDVHSAKRGGKVGRAKKKIVRKKKR